MADFLDEKKREIKSRLDELRPLVDEFHRLEGALAALDAVPGGGATPRRTATTRTRRTAAPARKRSSGGATGTGRRGRPKGSGTRGKQALELVRSRPGITIPELAEAMGIQQNYLYRVMPDLQKAGSVRKEGRGWHPMESK